MPSLYRIINCLVLVNFESRRAKSDIDQISVIYSTRWGELYNVQGIDKVKKLRADLFDVKPKPATHLLAPEGKHKKRLYDNFKEKTGMEFKYKL